MWRPNRGKTRLHRPCGCVPIRSLFQVTDSLGTRLGFAAVTAVAVFISRRVFLAPKRSNWPIHGHVGAVILLFGQIGSVTFRPQWLGIFLTPTLWTGYILLIDSLIFRVRGESLIRTRRRAFLVMLPLSIGCWLIFEAYNLHLQNWIYVGLPDNWFPRSLGYAWSFATIFPGIFLTDEFLRVTRRGNSKTGRKRKLTNQWLMASGLVGSTMLVVPLLLPTASAQYLFGLVWLGWVFLLDPLLYKWKQPSILGDFKKGDYQRVIDLLVAGCICGVLWEFWNYLAVARWVYVFPLMQGAKIFEMPLPGFLGFPFFALECDLMYRTLLETGRRFGVLTPR